jgi:hypothetical protein
MKLPAGPKTPAWLLKMQFAADPLGWMDSLSKQYGDTFTVMSGSTPIVFVGNPQGMKQIFTTPEIVAAGELNQEAAPLVAIMDYSCLMAIATEIGASSSCLPCTELAYEPTDSKFVT